MEDVKKKKTRANKISARKRRERAAARKEIVRRASTDDESAEALIDHLGERYGASNVERYVNGMPDDELADRLEEATWEIEADRARDRRYVEDADFVVEQLAEKFPGTDAGLLGDLKTAHIAALWSGVANTTVIGAINETCLPTGSPSRTWVEALLALGKVAA